MRKCMLFKIFMGLLVLPMLGVAQQVHIEANNDEKVMYRSGMNQGNIGSKRLIELDQTGTIRVYTGFVNESDLSKM